jgi:hypothetical protein
MSNKQAQSETKVPVCDLEDHELERLVFVQTEHTEHTEHTEKTSDTMDAIVVYMDEEEFQTPFGIIKTPPFLELFWRKTGADCDGEEEEMEFPGSGKYLIRLCDTRPIN